MHRIDNYSIGKESFEDMLHAKRFNPYLEITFRDKSGQHTQKLSAGDSDVLDVYREGLETYVLSTNSRLAYIGLEIFESAGKIGEVFIEACRIKKALGREYLAPFNAIKRLRDHIM